ncbi:hypothetical protein AC1031_018353 [Aphanomyces cochlioides]|nr:hypothetical protein AC1031_018353 [Aphanomyces cochlioides]
MKTTLAVLFATCALANAMEAVAEPNNGEAAVVPKEANLRQESGDADQSKEWGRWGWGGRWGRRWGWGGRWGRRWGWGGRWGGGWGGPWSCGWGGPCCNETLKSIIILANSTLSPLGLAFSTDQLAMSPIQQD